jgi:hypothetical protein
MNNTNLAYRYDDYTYLKVNCYAFYILNYSNLYAPSCGAICLMVLSHASELIAARSSSKLICGHRFS